MCVYAHQSPAFWVPVATLTPINAPMSLHPVKLSPGGLQGVGYWRTYSKCIHTLTLKVKSQPYSSNCQLIRKYIDRLMGWDGDAGNTRACQFQTQSLSWLKWGCIHTRLRLNTGCHQTRAPTGESCTVPSCVSLPACLSLERDSVMRERCRHSWNHLNFKCMRWLCQWISPVTYCGII